MAASQPANSNENFDPVTRTFFPLQYGIVIDAGSSRSNVYLYEWPGEKENETGVVTEMMNCRVDGESKTR